ncbi:MAG: DUF5668 domain-containing protein [Chloroflexota bacterium]|nr:DUF5668 domain-containing protein [Chloroflexota bacterium]
MSTETTTLTPPSSRPPRRRGMFWPLVLIGIGLLALLANYGLVEPVSFVSILALWPVLLILLGIDIAFSRRWPLPTLGAELIIVAAALLLAAIQPSALSLATFTFSSSGCTNPAASVSAPRASMTTLSLRIDGGAARYELASGSSDAISVLSEQGGLCLRDRTGTSARGDVVLSQSGTRFGSGSLIAVRVPPDLPLSLTMNAGAGEFTLDLHDVKTTDARLNLGASSTTIVLPRPTGDVPLRVEGGASSLVLELASDVEARITVSGGLMSLSTTNPRLAKTGNTVETAGYAAAKDRVTVTINGGVTSVAVR